MLPRTIYLLRPNQVIKFKFATSNGLGGDSFTRKFIAQCDLSRNKV